MSKHVKIKLAKKQRMSSIFILVFIYSMCCFPLKIMNAYFQLRELHTYISAPVANDTIIREHGTRVTAHG